MSMTPFNVLVWNVRELNNPARRNVMSQVVAAAKPSIIYFQETNMKVVASDVVRHCPVNKFMTVLLLACKWNAGRDTTGLGCLSGQLVEPSLHRQHSHGTGPTGGGSGCHLVAHGCIRTIRGL